MSHFDTRIAPLAGSVSYIRCSSPKRIAFELNDMLVEVLTGRVVVSGALDELQTRCGFRLSWSMEARWEIQSRVPSILGPH